MNLRKIIREEIEGVFTDIHGKKSSKVEYTGVVVEGDQAKEFEQEIIKRLIDLGIEMPEGWNTPENYHMTITLGELSLGMKMSGAIGSEIELTCHSLGVSDEAMAIGVSGLFSRNPVQHISILFKDRPAASNDITEWTEFQPFKVTGYVREVHKNDGFGRLRQIEI